MSTPLPHDQSIAHLPGSRRDWLRRLRRLAITFLAIYAGFCLMLALLQRSLIYLPTREPAIKSEDANFPAGQVHTIQLRTNDGLTLRGWHILPDGCVASDHQACDRELAAGGYVVLYFSGNAGNRLYRSPEFEVFTRLGCHVLCFDYRGYGENPGSPSEERLATDALAAWRYATRERGIAAERIIICGESLGGGVAVRLAADLSAAAESPGGLILRSTFSSLVDTAAIHYRWLPVQMLMVDRYPSVERIGSVTCPILHIHGQVDAIVPITLGRKLFEAAPPQSAAGIAKRLVELPGANHNDLLYMAEREYRQAIADFLAQLP